MPQQNTSATEIVAEAQDALTEIISRLEDALPHATAAQANWISAAIREIAEAERTLNCAHR